MTQALINAYRQAEDYFFRGIASKCLNLGVEATAYMTGGALAKTLGAHYCFLEASASGLSIYQKLGFEELFKNNIYSRAV